MPSVRGIAPATHLAWRLALGQPMTLYSDWLQRQLLEREQRSAASRHHRRAPLASAANCTADVLRRCDAARDSPFKVPPSASRGERDESAAHRRAPSRLSASTCPICSSLSTSQGINRHVAELPASLPPLLQLIVTRNASVAPPAGMPAQCVRDGALDSNRDQNLLVAEIPYFRRRSALLGMQSRRMN